MSSIVHAALVQLYPGVQVRELELDCGHVQTQHPTEAIPHEMLCLFCLDRKPTVPKSPCGRPPAACRGCMENCK